MCGVATHVREEKDIGDRPYCMYYIYMEKKIETKKYLKKTEKSLIL